MRRMTWCRWTAVCMVLALLLSGCRSVPAAGASAKDEHILIDPGHGGLDGGTVAEDGTLEKNINLAVSLYLHDLLVVCGFPVRMTRNTDISIHSAGATNKKVSDMHNRLAMYESASMIISIHQNHFSVEKYSGAQVFYSGNAPESQRLATCMRQEIILLLQPDNGRELKKASDGIFLLHHTTKPAVLVECGFLSNTAERELLKSAAYQQRLAFAVTGGCFTYFMQE